MTDCFGCGAQIWTPKNENESGEFCSRNGECEITDFEGVNRLKEAYLDNLRATCAHEWKETADGMVKSCVKCHTLK